MLTQNAKVFFFKFKIIYCHKLVTLFYLGQFCHYFWKATMSDWILLLYVDVIVYTWSKFIADLANLC